MAGGIKALRKIQLGQETTDFGTAVAATTVWRGMGELEDNREVVFPEEDIGLLMETDRNYVPKLEGLISFDSVEATFEQLGHVLQAGIRTVSPTTDASSGFTYTYNFPYASSDDIDAVPVKTYTIRGGDNQEAEKMAYSFVQSFTLEGNAGEALMVSADWLGREVETTDFTASTDAPIPTVEEILFSKGKLYIDNDTDSFGNTQVSNTLLSATLNYNTGLIPKYTADGELYFSFHQRTTPEITLDVTFEHDGNAATEKANWRNKTARLIRLRFDGAALGTTDSGATYDKKTLILDLPGKWADFEPLDEQDGNATIAARFNVRYNATIGNAGKAILVNELSALA